MRGNMSREHAWRGTWPVKPIIGVFLFNSVALSPLASRIAQTPYGRDRSLQGEPWHVQIDEESIKSIQPTGEGGHRKTLDMNTDNTRKARLERDEKPDEEKVVLIEAV